MRAILDDMAAVDEDVLDTAGVLPPVGESGVSSYFLYSFYSSRPSLLP
jgi:hypothetical protein